MRKIFIIYLIAVNIISFLLYGIDKRKAIKEKYRIPEASLIGVAVIGGSIGAMLGMKLFHHKTLHKKFSIGLPLIFAAQIALIIWLKVF